MTDAEFIAWFAEDRFGAPRTDWDLEALRYALCRVPERKAELLWAYVLEHNLFAFDARRGWIARSGRFFGCNWAAHERLLDELDLDVKDAETAGWARVNLDRVQCLYPLSKGQERTLLNKGISTDKVDTLLSVPQQPRLRLSDWE